MPEPGGGVVCLRRSSQRCAPPCAANDMSCIAPPVPDRMTSTMFRSLGDRTMTDGSVGAAFRRGARLLDRDKHPADPARIGVIQPS